MGYGSKEKNLYLNDELIINLTIPHGVTRIGSRAFRGCIGLTSVTIPNSVTDMEFGAFEYCSGLTSVTIPDSITEVGNSVFDGCSGLMSVTIPNSVTRIGSYAFAGCSGLTSIEFNGTKSQWNAVSKTSGWNSNTGAYTIHCTDGDIAKS